MTRPIRRTSDDWSVITTEQLPTSLPEDGITFSAVLEAAVNEGRPPNYIPPRKVPDERREYARREIRDEIRVTLAGQELMVRGHDVSAGGMCCGALPHWARRGDPILVQLPGREHHVLGRVAWVRRESEWDDEKRIGVRFTTPQCGLHVLD